MTLSTTFLHAKEEGAYVAVAFRTMTPEVTHAESGDELRDWRRSLVAAGWVIDPDPEADAKDITIVVTGGTAAIEWLQESSVGRTPDGIRALGELLAAKGTATDHLHLLVAVCTVRGLQAQCAGCDGPSAHGLVQ